MTEKPKQPKEIAQFSAIIDGIHSKKDLTLSIKLGTQELPAEEMAVIFDQQGKQIWVAFCETAMKRTDFNIPEVTEEFEKKTPSQRLRDRLAAYYKELVRSGKDFEGFDEWYKKEMEKIGQAYLGKLN